MSDKVAWSVCQIFRVTLLLSHYLSGRYVLLSLIDAFSSGHHDLLGVTVSEWLVSCSECPGIWMADDMSSWLWQHLNDTFHDNQTVSVFEWPLTLTPSIWVTDETIECHSIWVVRDVIPWLSQDLSGQWSACHSIWMPSDMISMFEPYMIGIYPEILSVTVFECLVKILCH